MIRGFGGRTPPKGCPRQDHNHHLGCPSPNRVGENARILNLAPKSKNTLKPGYVLRYNLRIWTPDPKNHQCQGVSVIKIRACWGGRDRTEKGFQLWRSPHRTPARPPNRAQDPRILGLRRETRYNASTFCTKNLKSCNPTPKYTPVPGIKRNPDTRLGPHGTRSPFFYRKHCACARAGLQQFAYKVVNHTEYMQSVLIMWCFICKVGGHAGGSTAK